jgi:hypothetical protein
MKVRSVGVRRVWDCILCACVSEEGGDGKGADSETPSLLSYILRLRAVFGEGSTAGFFFFSFQIFKVQAGVRLPALNFTKNGRSGRKERQ